jgi:acyl-CoA thioester hydrolase
MNEPPPTRDRFRHFAPIATRWMDNDVYGHVNNALYYSYFDTVINRYLIDVGGLDIAQGETIGLCVESHCRYLSPLAFPMELDAGLRVEHLGTASVRYGVGIFARGQEAGAAEGWFVHVFVDRGTRQATPIPPRLRDALSALVVAPPA